MALTRLALRQFRNHAATRLDPVPGFNVLVGENGAGKTNVLEAISLLAPGRGLRRAQPGEMAGLGGDGTFAIAAELESGAISFGTFTQPATANRRTVRINGADGPATRLAEWLAITWLTPAMDRLFSEGASGRRRFLDRLVLAVDPGHARLATRYEAALRERNRLLGDPAEPDPVWLDAIEAQLAETGAAIGTARRGLVERLATISETLPDAPFARPLLSYRIDTTPDIDALRTALADGRRRDRAAGRTLSGPHRDDLSVILSTKNAAAADCSTGEQKALLIAIILAHATIAAGDRARLLLLDEVAAHLDPVRRGALYERLAGSGAQVWMTGTELAPFAGITDAACWRVRDGQVERD